VRFYKTLIGMKDDFYDRHLEKHNSLEPLVDLLIRNGNRYNLLNSALLELFDFIKKVTIASVVPVLWSHSLRRRTELF